MESHLALVGERTGMTFKIGQKVRIRVAKADPETSEIDIELIEAETVETLSMDSNKNRRQRRSQKQPEKKENKPKEQQKDRQSNKQKNKPKKGKAPFYQGAPKKKGKKGR